MPLNVIKEMENEGLSGKDAIEIALNTSKTPEKLYKAKLRKLLSENEYHASMIALNNIAIDELKNKLGFEGTLEELKEQVFIDDNEKAIQTTLERFEHIKGESSLSIGDFINTREGKRIIKSQLSKCDLTEEDFISLLFEKHEKSRQTTLDS